MATSKASQKAVNKYVKANYERINVTIKKGSKQAIEEAAKANNESVNGYIKNAVKSKIKSDTGKDVDL